MDILKAITDLFSKPENNKEYEEVLKEKWTDADPSAFSLKLGKGVDYCGGMLYNENRASNYNGLWRVV